MMPVFSFHTNVAASKVTPDLLKQISALVARILHKPESYVCVHVVPDQHMIFAGTDEPCGVGVLKSIGGVGGSKNNEHAKALFALIKDHLGISGNRMYVEFIDIGAADIAFNSKTFA
nr:Macrophage migration inhibitory factor domain containing protein [Haemonchus contortus]